MVDRSPKSLAEDDVVSATAVDNHVQGAQSHLGSFKALLTSLASRFKNTFFA